jgi:hypothetical protein
VSHPVNGQSKWYSIWCAEIIGWIRIVVIDAGNRDSSIGSAL